MPLAVTALDVALVGSLAALAAAVLTPLSSWIVTLEAHRHERRLARDERVFQARRAAYEELGISVHRGLVLARLFYGRLEDPASYPDDPVDESLDDSIAQAGRIGVLGSPEVAREFDAFAHAGFEFFKAVAPVWAACENEDSSHRLATPEELAPLKPLLDELGSQRDAVLKEANEDLMGLPK